MKVILVKDLLILGRLKKKGTVLEVTNDYAKRLVKDKIARKENVFDKLKKK